MTSRLLHLLVLLPLAGCLLPVADPPDPDGDGFFLSEDCDESKDGGSELTPNTFWFADSDNDGYGDRNARVQSCEQPAGYVRDYTDCNDKDRAINPETVWFADSDKDTYGDANDSKVQCKQPSGYVRLDTDCNDLDSRVHPEGREEAADGVDQNCDGRDACYRDRDGDGYGSDDIFDGNDLDCDDPGESTTNDDCNDSVSTGAGFNPATTWYIDVDGDSFGNASVSTQSCTQPSGYVRLDTDCDDGNNVVNPNTTWYRDQDGDGYGWGQDSIVQCTQPTGYVLDGNDCDDSLQGGNLGPGTVWSRDADNDGYGDASDQQTQCVQPSGYVLDATDCDDTPVTGTEFNPNTQWFPDVDDDGYGDPTGTILRQCTKPLNHVRDNTDCDDTAGSGAAINPMSMWYPDVDGDGYGDMSASPTQTCVAPSNTVLDNTDCDDNGTDGQLYNPTTLWYADADGDGFGDMTDTPDMQCTQPSGTVLDNTDCDDTVGSGASINPDTLWYIDADGDGYGDANDTPDQQCTAPDGDHVLVNTDCDDTVGSGVGINPETLWYPDVDGDTYGDTSGTPLQQCTQPANHVLDSTDCDDTAGSGAAINPETLWYADVDGDGFGDMNDTPDMQCAQPSNTVMDNTDCDDNSTDGNLYNPDTAWSADVDGDGYGDANDQVVQCTQPTGYVLDDQDCDDNGTDGHLYNPTTLWYLDADNDTFGDENDTPDMQCAAPDASHVLDNTDCDDTVGSGATIYPGATEVVADTIDQDCDTFDSCYEDLDNDDYGTANIVPASSSACDTLPNMSLVATDCEDDAFWANPGRVEVNCDDGSDNDCDGTVDNGCSATATPTADGQLLGVTDNSWTGGALTAGDFDNNGTIDVAVGAPGTSDGGVYLAFGTLTAGSTNLSDYVGGGLGFAGVGSSLATAHFSPTVDTNDDLVIAAPQSTSGKGRVTVLFGPLALSGGETLQGYAGNGTEDDVLYTGASIDDEAGWAISVGDMNGDTAHDLLIGAPGNTVGNGRAYLVHGPPSQAGSFGLADEAVATFSGTGGAGTALATGDLDGDGMDDMLIGSDQGGSAAGKAWVVLGGTHSGDMILDVGADVVVGGATTGDRAGSVLAIPGDFDGDGYDDALFGAPTDNVVAGGGRAYLHYGASDFGASSSLNLNTADVRIDGAAGQAFATTAASGGDIDGDQRDDLLIGATEASDEGRVYVFYGALDAGTYSTSAAAAMTPLGTAGDEALNGASLGDLDSDGLDDIGVGAPGQSNTGTAEGAAWFFFGSSLP